MRALQYKVERSMKELKTKGMILLVPFIFTQHDNCKRYVFSKGKE